jgi:hypothetical protein
MSLSQPRRKWSSRRGLRILSFLVFALGTAVAAGLILEAVYRLTDSASVPSAPAAIVADDALGWDSNPSVEALDNQRSGPVVYFVGDSFTQSASWPRHAHSLAREQGIHFQGYNLGVSGYGVTQSFLKVQREFSRHKPALVVLQLYPWNDLRDDYAYPGVFYGPDRSRRPYFVRNGEGFSLRPPPPTGRFRSWLGQSQVFQRVLLRGYLRATRILAEQDLDLFSRRGIAAHVHYHESVAWSPFYLPSEQNRLYVRNAYAAFEHALVALDTFLSERGAKLAVLAIGNAFTVDEEVLHAHASGLDFRPTLAVETIGGIAESHGIPFLSLVEPLRALARQSGAKVYNPPPGTLAAHLQPEGEAVVGRAASDVIARILRANGEGPASPGIRGEASRGIR